ncbi:MAG: MFS transporter, partial [Nitrospirae bacterium]|nr:MFS transporter [Magnetococcales bacterium]
MNLDRLNDWILPPTTSKQARTLLIGRALRAFCDGYVSVLLPAYLLALGLGAWEVGLIGTATLLGSALATLAVGTWGHRLPHRRLLSGAALLMAATGIAFAGFSSFWPLLLAAFVGTLNPSAGDVSLFLPLEHARLAEAADGDARTTLFARYSLVGSLFAAAGFLAVALPEWLTIAGLEHSTALRGMFLLYGGVGLLVWWLYRKIPDPTPHQAALPKPLGASRGVVVRLAVLFSVDAFAGGMIVHSLLALWLFQRFDLSLAAASYFFFWAGLATACSLLAAPWVTRRIGLLNTMVFMHLPSNILLILAALVPNLELSLGLLILRGLLSQMDVPTRSAFVMAVVTPPERVAAASFTSVPRSLAAAIGPLLGGALFAAGWLATPLVACGLLKIVYDLALLFSFRRYRGIPVQPPPKKLLKKKKRSGEFFPQGFD